LTPKRILFHNYSNSIQNFFFSFLSRKFIQKKQIIFIFPLSGFLVTSWGSTNGFIRFSSETFPTITLHNCWKDSASFYSPGNWNYFFGSRKTLGISSVSQFSFRRRKRILDEFWVLREIPSLREAAVFSSVISEKLNFLVSMEFWIFSETAE